MKLFQAANGEPVSLDRLRDVGVELIAVTTRPGMGGSLDTGLRFAQVWSLDISFVKTLKCTFYIDIQWSMTLTDMRSTVYMRLKKSYDGVFHSVNNLHDFTGMHGLSRYFC